MTLPIGIGDIALAVGYASGDLGTLIRSGVINKWAKFKPVRNGALDYSAQMNSGKTEWGSGATWWRANDGHCGLSIQEYTALGDPFSSATDVFLKKLRLEQLPWDYLRPQGGVGSQPYRAFDFFRYNSDAQAPVGALAATDIWLDSEYGGQFDWDTPAADTYALGLSDILLNNQAMTNYYLGVLLWRSNGTYYFLTASSKFTAGGSISIPFTASQGMIGSWKMVPFISSRQYAIGANAQSGVYASLFGLGNSDIVLHAPGTILDFVVQATWNSQGTQISYELTITNHGSSSRTITNTAVEVRSVTGAQEPAAGQLEATAQIGTVTVAGNSSVTRMGTISVTRSANKEYYVHGYADGFTNAGYDQIEEDPDLL